MNLSIVLTDFIDNTGVLRTYRFVPVNPYNKVVVDRIEDIYTDVKGNTGKDMGRVRIYNSDKCELISTKCKIKNFSIDKFGKIHFCLEHINVPVESSKTGSCGIYNFVLPVGYKLTELHIVDPFDKSSPIKNKKHFKYDVFYDDESKLQIVEMQLRSRWESFSFILKGEASNELYLNEFIDYEEQKIYLDKDIREFIFDQGIRKSFWQSFKESLLMQPNFNGIGIDLKTLFSSRKHD